MTIPGALYKSIKNNNICGNFNTFTIKNEICLKYNNIKNINISDNKYITIIKPGTYYIIVLSGVNKYSIVINNIIKTIASTINYFNLDKDDIISIDKCYKYNKTNLKFIMSII
jgi:hypothetical protein